MRPLRLVLLASAALVAACSSTTPGPEGPGPRSDSRTVTQSDLQAATQANLYDYVVAARPRWLQGRGPTRIGAGAGETRLAIAVFHNNHNLGGPEALRGFPLSGVQALRYFDAAEAQARFNVRDIGAIIQIITQ